MASDAHVGALADALGIPQDWSRKLLRVYGADLAGAAQGWREDREQAAEKAGIVLPGGGGSNAGKAGNAGNAGNDGSALSSTAGEAGTSGVLAARSARKDSPHGGGESKKSVPDPVSSSFFDFSNRHTSHLSSPAAQPVSWMDRKTPFMNVPEGISKPSSARAGKQHGDGAAKQPPSATATPRTGAPSNHLPVSSVTASAMARENTTDKESGSRCSVTSESNSRSKGGSGGVSRKHGSIPGYRRPQRGSSAAGNPSRLSSGQALTASSVAYDVVFIMDQLARGKITQEQFDQLNAVLM